MLPGVRQLYFFLLRSKLDNKVLVFHPVVYKEYSYHETYSETLTTSTGSKKMTPRGKYSHHTAKSTESRLFAAAPTDTSDPSSLWSSKTYSRPAPSESSDDTESYPRSSTSSSSSSPTGRKSLRRSLPYRKQPARVLKRLTPTVI